MSETPEDRARLGNAAIRSALESRVSPTLRETVIIAIWTAINPSTEGDFRMAAGLAAHAITLLPEGMFADEITV
jgi:hypothetical protein